MTQRHITTARPPILPSVSLQANTPAGACDTHMHIFGGPDEFPAAPGNTENPAAGDLNDWIAMLLRHFDSLGLERGVIVHSVVYAEDNSLTAEALRRLGTENFRGIALVAPDISDAALDALHESGFRGVRLNLSFTGALDLGGLKSLAPRLADRGWHALVNLPRYVGLKMTAIIEDLRQLPVSIVFDHYGYPDLEAGTNDTTFQTYLSLLETGQCWVKLSASYRQSPPPYDALDPFVSAMVSANPDRLLWASDWPHVRWPGDMPDNAVQMNTLIRQIPDERTRKTILVDNPATLYGFTSDVR